ncbi:signal recognition particle 19 kDa protein-like [Argiope bruennichi]|uniref:Signal recognition particle 19 kDa protein like n=1 Tax=Argiope bruennichi TaxID=94029 RepID=A0A8T0FUA3_ARGBR|nr:signal recognition particle 19 kDa protein-like [Argiope bruennichi]KAF8793778.1 Signal recognition particle 19 kDa protein like [Argiope bruennichi]
MVSYYADKKYSDRERWLCIYPAYINSKKTFAEGRRIKKDKCVENPTCQEIRDVLDAASFQIGVENKLYSREQNKDSVIFRGRVRVQFKNDDGSVVNPKFKTRKELLEYIAETIPKLKSRTQSKSTDQPQNVQSAKKGNKKKRR